MNQQYYSTHNFHRLGIKYAKIEKPSVHWDSDQDCNGFSENEYEIQISPDSPDLAFDLNDPLISLDKLEDVINNNPLLNEKYLVDSEIIQSTNVETNADIYNSPLYPGTDTSVLDLIIILELIKTTVKLGEINESIILGLLASFLPPNNAIKLFLSESTSSIYHFQKLIKKSHDAFNKSLIVKIPICNFCFKTPFCGKYRMQPRCQKCRTLKDLKSPNQKYIFYLPLKDRLYRLLVSDLRNLFHYPELRNLGNEDYIQDTFDGSNWQSFVDLMDSDKNEKLIGLQWCWDGADSFTFSGKSFWPGCISILNFPLDLRSKLHVGMHVISLCDGELLTLI
jgi:hypothetical protein